MEVESCWVDGEGRGKWSLVELMGKKEVES